MTLSLRFLAPMGLLWTLWLLGACAAPPPDGGGAWFGSGGKADLARVELSVAAARPDGTPGELVVPLASYDHPVRLVVRVSGEAPESGWQLQLEARSSTYARRSVTGAQPFLVLPPTEADSYEIVLRNASLEPALAVMLVSREAAPAAGAKIYFNQPDCDDGCSGDRLIRDGDDPSNGMREAIIDAIQGARRSIDISVFGIEDAGIQEALCNAALSRQVTLRVVTDWRSLDPDNSRGYYAALEALGDCIEPLARGGEGSAVFTDADFAARGIQFVMHNAIMHHKFYVIDRDTEHELLVTGSANQTTNGLEKNHNHMLFIRGVPGLVEAYGREFDQLFDHCRSNQDSRGRACNECTPTCSADVNEEGTWVLDDAELGTIEMWAYFSPTRSQEAADDALRVLRGPTASRDFKIAKRGPTFCVNEERGAYGARQTFAHSCVTAISTSTADLATARAEATTIRDGLREQPDPACIGPDAACVCHRASSGRYACDYCGGADGTDFGLLGQAARRVRISVFAGTDLCFGLAAGRAASRPGVHAVAIFDRVNSFSEYSRDDFMSAMGAETYVDDWAGQSALIFNHNKIVVVDDVVFDGSMNISASGAEKNNENTVVYRGAAIADLFSGYIEAEAALLRRRSVRRIMSGRCEEGAMGGRCDAIQTAIDDADPADGVRQAELADGLRRCYTAAGQWALRCIEWQATPAAYVTREVQTMDYAGHLYDNPKSQHDSECNDRVDNDGDGLVDQDAASCGESLCFDGHDNDGDGLVDESDPDCDATSESPRPGSTPGAL